MLQGQMSPRHLPTHTEFGQVWTINIRDMASYLLVIYSVGNNNNMNNEQQQQLAFQ